MIAEIKNKSTKYRFFIAKRGSAFCEIYREKKCGEKSILEFWFDGSTRKSKLKNGEWIKSDFANMKELRANYFNSTDFVEFEVEEIVLMDNFNNIPLFENSD